MHKHFPAIIVIILLPIFIIIIIILIVVCFVSHLESSHLPDGRGIAQARVQMQMVCQLERQVMELGLLHSVIGNIVSQKDMCDELVYYIYAIIS